MEARIHYLAILLFFVVLSTGKSPALVGCVNGYDEVLNGECLTSACNTSCVGSGGGGFGILQGVSAPTHINIDSVRKLPLFPRSFAKSHVSVVSDSEIYLPTEDCLQNSRRVLYFWVVRGRRFPQWGGRDA